MSPMFSRLLLLWLLSSLPLAAGTIRAAERSLDDLVRELTDGSPFDQERAEVRIREAGEAWLPDLLRQLEGNSTETFLRLQPIVDELIETRVETLRGELRLDTEERRELELLETALDRPAEGISEAQLREIRSRLESVRKSIADREPVLAESTRNLRGLLPAAARNLLRQKELSPPFLGERLGKFLVDLTSESSLSPPELTAGSTPALHQIWGPYLGLLELARSEEPGSRSESLGHHLELARQELDSPHHALRRLAEDALFLQGSRGLETLRSAARSSAEPRLHHLADLLAWRIHPGLALETGLDFSDYEQLDFRARRQHIIAYARTAGERAIPTLHRVVSTDGPEKSIRVQITAAEALAGLGDISAIQELQRRSMPELMKIPEISRDFFLLKGIQYTREKKYALAVAEFQKILRDNPFEFSANYQIAFAYLLMKEYEKSIEHFETARRLRPTDTLTLYNLACAYSLAGKIDPALEALEASVKAGFDDADHIRQDPDLTALRTHEQYAKILALIEGR